MGVSDGDADADVVPLLSAMLCVKDEARDKVNREVVTEALLN